ncbi:MAG: hypothetical protein A2V88_07680 [Elusimicrobia bacterium RBG_16_66_12]|nr:MAG: hypothetical protein A2V88_07680 [Elusimicrobia bacterium RBG_16_66_12]
MSDPFVTVVVLCRDEERSIGRCLDSVLASDYPRARMEVLVVDGMSTDGTRAVVEEYARRYDCIRALANPKRTIPAGMNLAFAHARGVLVLKMDAHSDCPPNYISECVRHSLASGADNVGGVARIASAAETPTARAIACVLAHPFGSGTAYVKVGARTPRWADTALFGCYKREVFERIGPWNEALAGSSDLDFNARLRAAGGRILLVPDIVVRYHADGDLRSFWRHNFADGVWATYVLKFRSRGWSWRHWVPLGFVTSLAALGVVSVVWRQARGLLAGAVALYLLVTAAASLHVAIRERDPRLAPAAFLAFAIRHLAHGLGAAWGLVLLGLPGVRWQGRRGRYA